MCGKNATKKAAAYKKINFIKKPIWATFRLLSLLLSCRISQCCWGRTVFCFILTKNRFCFAYTSLAFHGLKSYIKGAGPHFSIFFSLFLGWPNFSFLLFVCFP